MRYRATDRGDTNTSAVQQVTFSVVAGEACLPALSDEFNGALDTSRWSFRHPTTPATGAGAPSVADGSLVLPLGAYSLDLTRTGPARAAGPAAAQRATSRWSRRSPLRGSTPTSAVEGSPYAQVGLKIFQTNDNWIKVAHTRNADGNPTGSAKTYFEIAYETNGTRTLGTRMGLGAGTNLPTWWMRVVRTGTTITASYSLTDPEARARTGSRSARRTSTR